MRIGLLFIVLLIGGCVTKPITLPDGTQGYAVECKNSLAICYNKASKLCPTGYDFVDNDKSGSGSAIALVSGGSGGASSSSTTNITRVIRCKSGAAMTDSPAH